MKCPWCGREFETSEALRLHLKFCPVKKQNEEPAGDAG